MFYVSKIAVVAMEKGIKVSDEQIKLFFENGYFIEGMDYYIDKVLKIIDKEKIRQADIVFILYKNRISRFGQNVIKYAAKFHKKIIIKRDIEPTDL